MSSTTALPQLRFSGSDLASAWKDKLSRRSSFILDRRSQRVQAVDCRLALASRRPGTPLAVCHARLRLRRGRHLDVEGRGSDPGRAIAAMAQRLRRRLDRQGGDVQGRRPGPAEGADR